ncbi:MAG: GyrI-like domain-containing protein [Alphaproteobacteria bacterium]|nr:GyrI-like domain-containing protein [Alphaproteobacteria bacterium]
MPEVTLETVEPQLLAAVRASVEIKDIPNAWQPGIYAVKAFLAERPDLAGARQVFLYHHPGQRQTAMDIDFGIEVAKPFAEEGSVKCVSTPGGQVATSIHPGSLNGLPQTHMGIHQWCAANGHKIGGFSWETYEWGDGPNPIRTIVRYALD